MSVIIGLTGGIGSGKSIVAKVFKLIEAFGNEVYSSTIDKNGNVAETLNRSYLSKIVFSDTYQLEILNAIVHPITIQAAINWAAAQTAPYVIKEAALFFESGSSKGVSKIIGVSAPKALRIHRVMKRDHCTKEEVEKRMTYQIEETIKMKLCDYVIVNNDQQLVIPQVVTLHEKLLAELK